jgi:alanine racemase
MLTVSVDLERVTENIRAIRRRCGVPVLAVIKADAYGLGAGRMAAGIASLVDGFCLFSLEEAVAIELWKKTHKPAITFGPPSSLNAEDYLEQHVRPAVSTVEQATALRRADPILCVDTGMRRFACPAERIDAVLTAGQCREAFTHAPRLEQAMQLKAMLGGKNIRLHAAASSLLDEPAAYFDAVRPGLAIYQGAVRIESRLVEIHDSRDAAMGYSHFSCPRVGVILAGYSHGLRPGPCLLNGQLTRILETGMQSSYIEVAASDKVGDEVVLLGDSLDLHQIAQAWHCTSHEVLLRLAFGARKQ